MNKKAIACFEKWEKSLNNFEEFSIKLSQSKLKATKEENEGFGDVLLDFFNCSKEVMPYLSPEQATKLRNTVLIGISLLGVNPKEMCITSDSDIVSLNLDAQYIIESAKILLEDHMDLTLDDYNEGKVDKKTMEMKMKSLKKIGDKVNGF